MKCEWTCLAVRPRAGPASNADRLEVNMLFLGLLAAYPVVPGFMTSYTLGGLLHILLVIAIVLLLVHVIEGQSIGGA